MPSIWRDFFLQYLENSGPSIRRKKSSSILIFSVPNILRKKQVPWGCFWQQVFWKKSVPWTTSILRNTIFEYLEVFCAKYLERAHVFPRVSWGLILGQVSGTKNLWIPWGFFCTKQMERQYFSSSNLRKKYWTKYLQKETYFPWILWFFFAPSILRDNIILRVSWGTNSSSTLKNVWWQVSWKNRILWEIFCAKYLEGLFFYSILETFGPNICRKTCFSSFILGFLCQVSWEKNGYLQYFLPKIFQYLEGFFVPSIWIFWSMF